MPKKTKGTAIPKFLRNLPNTKKMDLIKQHSYDYLKAKAINDEELKGAMEQVAGFIEELA